MTPGDQLAKEVRAAMVPLQDARENSPAALKSRQARVYTALWVALERYDAAAGQRERRHG